MSRICFMKWTGSKYRVLGILYPLFPDCEEYYEPFLGSGSVLINKPRVHKEVANDLDRELYILHRVMADKERMPELLKRLKALEETKETFQNAVDTLEEYRAYDTLTREEEIEIAQWKYVKVALSFNGMGQNFGKAQRLGVEGSTGSHKFEMTCERYQGVEFRNGDGIELMAEVRDNPKAFVFADPPYVHKLRGNAKIYQCEMGDGDQVKMLESIRDAKCKIMLCGYTDENGNSLYDKYLFPYGWKRYKLAELTQSCQCVQKGRERKNGKEFIWVNYDLPECSKYFIAMDSLRSA